MSEDYLKIFKANQKSWQDNVLNVMQQESAKTDRRISSAEAELHEIGTTQQVIKTDVNHMKSSMDEFRDTVKDMSKKMDSMVLKVASIAGGIAVLAFFADKII